MRRTPREAISSAAGPLLAATITAACVAVVVLAVWGRTT